MRELAERPAQRVVLFVVHWLQVVALADFVVAVVAVGFVGVEVDLPEKSGLLESG